MDEHFSNISFWQITASCSNKNQLPEIWFFAKRNNILTQESLGTLQFPIFEYNTYELLFECNELAHSTMLVSTRGEMLQESIFLNFI